MDIYVDVRAGRDGNGAEKMPFRRINEAAKVAKIKVIQCLLDTWCIS